MVPGLLNQESLMRPESYVLFSGDKFLTFLMVFA